MGSFTILYYKYRTSWYAKPSDINFMTVPKKMKEFIYDLDTDNLINDVISLL